MLSLDRYFEKAKSPQLPPDARRVEARLGRFAKAVCLFDRERDGLSFRPASLTILFFAKGSTQPADDLKVEWDARLNLFLVERGIRAEDQEQEARRLALALKADLSSAEMKYGDGFFNSVLFQYLREHELAAREPIKSTMAATHALEPSFTEAYHDCSAFIDQTLKDWTQRLNGQLGYEKAQTVQVLVAGVNEYLDERFSVTNRRMLGFGSGSR